MSLSLAHSRHSLFAIIGLALLTGSFSSADAQNQVYVSRFWHDHQPIYWPEWNGNGSQTSRYQYAWDSITLANGQTYGTGSPHPSDNLSSIFSIADRVASYQGRP